MFLRIYSSATMPSTLSLPSDARKGNASSRTLAVDADCGGCNTGRCIEPEASDGADSDFVLGPSCDCRDTGYIGEHCDVSCSMTCENGGKCIPVDREGGRGEAGKEETCSCTKAVVDGNPYAGLRCEYEATKTCMTLGSVSKHSFCVNGGECSDIVLDNEQHKPCMCKKGFEGPHCEYLEGEAPTFVSGAAFASTGGGADKIDLVVFILIVAVASVIGGLLLAFFLRGRRRRSNEKRQEREARRATQEFAMVATDDDENEII